MQQNQSFAPGNRPHPSLLRFSQTPLPIFLTHGTLSESECVRLASVGKGPKKTSSASVRCLNRSSSKDENEPFDPPTEAIYHDASGKTSNYEAVFTLKRVSTNRLDTATAAYLCVQEARPFLTAVTQTELKTLPIRRRVRGLGRHYIAKMVRSNPLGSRPHSVEAAREEPPPRQKTPVFLQIP